MNRWIASMASVWALLMLLPAAGCTAPGVGDPCLPETVPPGGFVDKEAYLETRSVQCRTRVCMVYKLQGIPAGTPGSCEGAQIADNPDCASQQDTDDHVYCSCRCDAPDDAKGRLCACPQGYVCTEIIDQEAAGLGIRGSYCVKESTVAPTTM